MHFSRVGFFLTQKKMSIASSTLKALSALPGSRPARGRREAFAVALGAAGGRRPTSLVRTPPERIRTRLSSALFSVGSLFAFKHVPVSQKETSSNGPVPASVFRVLLSSLCAPTCEQATPHKLCRQRLSAPFAPSFPFKASCPEVSRNPRARMRRLQCVRAST